MVCWVTDVRTAFLTTHEKKEFDDLRSMLLNVSDDTGTLYQMAVVLTKYDYDDTQQEASESNSSPFTDEIMDDVEDTTVLDCCNRVKSLVPKGVEIIKYNAFGRIFHMKRDNKLVSSAALRNMTAKLAPTALNVNTQFGLGWATKDLLRKRQQTKLRTLILRHCVDADHDHFTMQHWRPVTVEEDREEHRIISDTSTVLELTEMTQDLLEFAILKSQDELEVFIDNHPWMHGFNVEYNDGTWNQFSRKMPILPQTDIDTFIALNWTHPVDDDSLETEICIPDCPSVLYRFICLAGSDHIAVARLYFTLTFSKHTQTGSYQFNDNPHYYHWNLCPEPHGYNHAEWKPEWFRMDQEVHNDPAVMCRLSWQARVATWRRRLWGHDEDDVDLGMVLNNRVALGSIFAPVGTYMRKQRN